MKKILFAIFMGFSLLYGEAITELTGAYIANNKKLIEVQSSSDLNSTATKSTNTIKDLEKKKQDILNKIPLSISEKNMSIKEESAEFFNRKKKLKDQVSRLKNHKDKGEFVLLSLELASLNLAEAYYTGLIGLEELFKKGVKSNEIIEQLDKTLEGMKPFEVFDTTAEKENIKSDEILAKIKIFEENIVVEIKSYKEIIGYLRENAKLLESNYIFSELKLQSTIDYTNSLFDFKHEYINIGKILLCLVVVVFIYSLRGGIIKLSFFIIDRILIGKKENSNAAFLREQLSKSSLTKALFYLMSAYSLDLCFSIAYYPSPTPLKVTSFFTIVYVLCMTWLIKGILDSYGMVLIANLAKRSKKKEEVNLIVKILYFIIMLIAVLAILSIFGFDVSTLIASLGIGGLAVALAAKDIIANFFASLILLFDDSFSQGDWIEIDGVEGNIVETGLRKTAIRTFDNCLVFIPNSNMLSSKIKNWSKRKVGRLVKMTVGVTYGAKSEDLRRCVIELKSMLDAHPLVAHEDDNALKSGDRFAHYRQNLVSINDLEGYQSACFVNLSSFGNSSIDIDLYFYTKAVDSKNHRIAKQEVMLEIMNIIERNNLSFAFPSTSLYIEKAPSEK